MRLLYIYFCGRLILDFFDNNHTNKIWQINLPHEQPITPNGTMN